MRAVMPMVSIALTCADVITDSRCQAGGVVVTPVASQPMRRLIFCLRLISCFARKLHAQATEVPPLGH